MKIKMTLRLHLTPVRIAIINNINDNKCWQGWGDVYGRNTVTLLVEMYICTTTIERVWKCLKKLKIELPYDPMMSLMGIYPRKYKLGHNRATCALMFIAVLCAIGRLWKWPRCPSIKQWINKIWCTYIYKIYVLYNGVLFSHEEEPNHVCSSMNGIGDHNVKLSKLGFRRTKVTCFSSYDEVWPRR
jgi:hypothetical protein